MASPGKIWLSWAPLFWGENPLNKIAVNEAITPLWEKFGPPLALTRIFILGPSLLRAIAASILTWLQD